MAKIQLKSANINPFGGLFSILNIFNRGGLRSVIDRPLGRRGGPRNFGPKNDFNANTEDHSDNLDKNTEEFF